MPRLAPIYTSFTAGELTPLVLGRTDLDQYSRGGQSFKNCIVTQYGPFMNRPGLMYVVDTKNHSTKTRLLEFIFDKDDSFIIEMGVSYFRFCTTAGQVGAPLEVAHTYTEDELFEVQYVQSNDVITLTHKNHKPAKLTRVSSVSWTLADYVFVGNPYLLDNTSSTTITPSAVTGTGITLTASASIFQAGHVGTFWKIGGTTGSPARQGFVKITGFSSGTSVTADVIVDLTGTTATVDWAEAAWSSIRGWPARCAYFQNRLFLARTNNLPNGIWGSKPFIFDDFNPETGDDDAAISDQAPEANEISWILGGRTLLFGTDSGDFIISAGDSSNVITPSSLAIRKQTNWGTEPIQPRLIDSRPYVIQLKGRKVRELSFFDQDDSYQSNDTTSVAEHITENGIVDFTYQRNPYSIMAFVRDDGKIASMTREVTQQVLGWTPWETDGEFESVAVIPHPVKDHDVIFAVVKRTINGSTKRYIEKFESPVIPKVNDQDKCFYVDSGLTYNAYEQTTGNTLTLSAVTGIGITATSTIAAFSTASIGKRIRAIDANNAIVGELKITGLISTKSVTADVVKDFDSTSYAQNLWGVSVTDISGLGHLEAKEVTILLDGGTTPNKTVSSGAIALANDGFVANIGLGYVSQWENMPMEIGTPTGTSQGKKKQISRISVKLYRSLGLKIGKSSGSLQEITTRNMETLLGQPESLFTGLSKQMTFSGWPSDEANIVIEQDKPLPMCVLAVIPFLDVYDK